MKEVSREQVRSRLEEKAETPSASSSSPPAVQHRDRRDTSTSRRVSRGIARHMKETDVNRRLRVVQKRTAGGDGGFTDRSAERKKTGDRFGKHRWVQETAA